MATCRKCDVINRGFSGYNTRWNKIILPRLVTSEMVTDIAAITILLGTNDSNESGSKQRVPIAEYKQNLIDMISYLQVSTFLRILYFTRLSKKYGINAWFLWTYITQPSSLIVSRCNKREDSLNWTSAL